MRSSCSCRKLWDTVRAFLLCVTLAATYLGCFVDTRTAKIMTATLVQDHDGMTTQVGSRNVSLLGRVRLEVLLTGGIIIR